MATDTADLPWDKEIAQNWANTRLAHEGMMLEKIQQEQKRVLHLADKVAGKPEADEADEDDMGVAIGNKINNHYHVTQAQQTVTSGLIKKSLPLAATLALGGVAGFAAPLLLAWWNKPTPPAATQPAPQQGYQLGLEVKNP